jgi:ABC-type glycerol-3-phosphate transport system permease component
MVIPPLMVSTESLNRILGVVVYLFMIVVTVLTIYPFLNVLAISFNDSVDTIRGGITIWPRQFIGKHRAADQTRYGANDGPQKGDLESSD